MNKYKPYYLCTCIENSCRSQVAEGLFNVLTQKEFAKSAGTKPSRVNPIAIDVVRERNIDIPFQRSKIITPELVQGA